MTATKTAETRGHLAVLTILRPVTFCQSVYTHRLVQRAVNIHKTRSLFADAHSAQKRRTYDCPSMTRDITTTTFRSLTLVDCHQLVTFVPPCPSLKSLNCQTYFPCDKNDLTSFRPDHRPPPNTAVISDVSRSVDDTTVNTLKYKTKKFEFRKLTPSDNSKRGHSSVTHP